MRRDADGIIDTLRTMVGTRLARSSLGSAAFTENLAPDNDDYADYVLAYEAVISPQRLDQARLELWVTEQGKVAVGIEKRGRVAERIQARTGSPDVFVAGHEPIAVEFAVLQQLLEAVASGALIIRARHAFGRLITTTAEVSLPEADPHEFRAYAKLLRIGDSIPFGLRVDLSYRPW